MLNARQKRMARRDWRAANLTADSIYWFSLALTCVLALVVQR